MGEEGVDEGGKAGMSRKLVAGIIVAVVVATGVGAAIWWNQEDNESYSSYDLTLYFDAQYSEGEWVVTLVNVTTNTRNYNIDPNTTHYETGTSELVDRDSFYNIRNSPSPYGIQWHDANNDKLVNVGDCLTVNRSGGSGGKLEAHKPILFYTNYGGSPTVYLPPAEFLEMDVVKTATGWNMTVTWVNETVPLNFLEGWRIGFRIMNETGAFGTFFGNGTGKIGWSVPLDMVDSTFNAEPGTYDAHNMTYYHIDWFDNDADRRLSVNDTIVINKFSELENTLKFSFTSGQYGHNHVVSEVTLP